MFQLTPSEIKFTIENEFCRLATSFKDRPHVIPVSYIYKAIFFMFQLITIQKNYSTLRKTLTSV